MTQAEITIVFAAVGTLATALTAIIAIATLIAARRDSRDRSRPLIIAELRREPLAHGTINLVVRNLGASPARNVHLSFPAFAGVSPETIPQSDSWHWILRRYEHAVDLWAPGWELRNTAKFGHNDRLDPFDIIVSYNSISDSPRRAKARYSDCFRLDSQVISTSSQAGPADAPTSGADWAGAWTKRGVRAIEVIARSLDAD